MEWTQIVREVLAEARTYAGSGAALADALHESGVGRDDVRYSESGISNWIKGRARPPADVLLAAAAFADLSLDQRIRPGQAVHRAGEPEDLRAQVEELRRSHGRLEALLIELYNRTGQPYPHERQTITAQRGAARGLT